MHTYLSNYIINMIMNPIHFFTLGYYPEYLFIGDGALLLDFTHILELNIIRKFTIKKLIKK